MADLHTLEFTAAHTLGFPVFTSRILATDSLSLQIVFAQPDSFLDISSQSSSTAISLRSLLQLPTPELYSVLCSQAHILAGWHLETQQKSTQLNSSL
jgi:hypothetical protein